MSHHVDIFDDMLGQIVVDIERDGDEELTFKMEDGATWRMYHQTDCCEYVTIDDIVGDLDDLIGHPILQAEAVACQNLKELPSEDMMWMVLTDTLSSRSDESETWTFYKFATIKGSVNIRWYGSSNGYYSEDVSFYKVKH